MKTPCEKVASNRAMFEEEGVELSESDWRHMSTAYHMDAEERGEPCPCGLKVSN